MSTRFAIQPDQSYSTEVLWIETGLPPQELRQAHADGRLAGQKTGDGLSIDGASLLRWIEECGIVLSADPASRGARRLARGIECGLTERDAMRQLDTTDPEAADELLERALAQETGANILAHRSYTERDAAEQLGLDPRGLTNLGAPRNGGPLPFAGAHLLRWWFFNRRSPGRPTSPPEAGAAIKAASKPGAGSLVDVVLAGRRDQQGREQAATARRKAQTWASYVALLTTQGEPTAQASQALERLMDDLGLTGDMVKQDAEIIRRSTELAQEDAGVEHATQEARAARERRDALVKRHAAELREAERALSRSQNRVFQTREALQKLSELRARRPELFAEAAPGDVPALLGLPCHAEAAPTSTDEKADAGQHQVGSPKPSKRGRANEPAAA